MNDAIATENPQIPVLLGFVYIRDGNAPLLIIELPLLASLLNILDSVRTALASSMAINAR